MAVKTIWPIDHICGHHADRDLSDRRASFAAWLARQEYSVNCIIPASLNTT